MKAVKTTIKPEIVRLPTGLEVMLVPSHEAQTATISILVKAGLEYETKEKNGISHFLEHMFFKGTKKLPTHKKIQTILDSMGARNSASTDLESINYYIKVGSYNLEKIIDIIADMYLNPLLKSTEIEKERGVIIEEINMSEDDPISKSWDVFVKMIYGNQTIGWGILGSKENIKKFGRNDFLNYLKNNYTADKTLIVVSGRFNRNKIIKIIKEKFKSIKTTSGSSKIATKLITQDQPRVSINYKKTEQANFILGGEGVNRFDDRRFTLYLLGEILGGSMSSRLFLRIREEMGMAYSIGFSASVYGDHGTFFAYGGVDPNNLEKVILAIKEELDKIANRAPSISELNKARECIKGSFLLKLETPDNWADQFSSSYFFKGKISSVNSIFKEYDKVRPIDIKNLAQELFNPKKMNLAIVGPLQKKDEVRFLKLL